MKTAWVILLVSAVTDFMIVAISTLTGAMAATGTVEMPNAATVLVSVLGGLLAFARTVQQALKSGMAGNMPSPTAQEPPLPPPPPPPGVPVVVTVPPPPAPPIPQLPVAKPLEKRP